MKTIVIIDDSQLVLKLTKQALERAGYRVQTLIDPGEFDPDANGTPDLLLVDINMPQFFGDDIVSYIKDTWSLTTPILLFSNASEKELLDAVARCGANGYISKHWGIEEMIACVHAILATPEHASP
ncbi:MAG TPA: response regulator [Kofleriaceae bacterium]|jgi:DNA-binding response OmpR family regulator|nr:response regulator [Kofleriaceae bacterium]